jgi:hypothetical protein
MPKEIHPDPYYPCTHPILMADAGIDYINKLCDLSLELVKTIHAFKNDIMPDLDNYAQYNYLRSITHYCTLHIHNEAKHHANTGTTNVEALSELKGRIMS